MHYEGLSLIFNNFSPLGKGEKILLRKILRCLQIVASCLKPTVFLVIFSQRSLVQSISITFLFQRCSKVSLNSLYFTSGDLGHQMDLCSVFRNFTSQTISILYISEEEEITEMLGLTEIQKQLQNCYNDWKNPSLQDSQEPLLVPNFILVRVPQRNSISGKYMYNYSRGFTRWLTGFEAGESIIAVCRVRGRRVYNGHLHIESQMTQSMMVNLLELSIRDCQLWQACCTFTITDLKD